MNFTDFYKFNMNFVMLWACFWFFFFSSIYIFVKCHLHSSLSEAKMRSQNWEFSFCILILNFATNCGKCFLHRSQGQWLLSSPFFFLSLRLIFSLLGVQPLSAHPSWNPRFWHAQNLLVDSANCFGSGITFSNNN